jgi:hypothetical protein
MRLIGVGVVAQDLHIQIRKDQLTGKTAEGKVGEQQRKAVAGIEPPHLRLRPNLPQTMNEIGNADDGRRNIVLVEGAALLNPLQKMNGTIRGKGDEQDHSL